MEDSSLIYVEGFATCVIPVLHAWVVDQDGVIYDPTWKVGKHKGHDYYGVPFSLMQCFKIMSKSKHYGLLDAWTAGWPLFKEKFKKEVTL
jgi:hypothetical protein